MHRALIATVLLLSACASQPGPTAPGPQQAVVPAHEWLVHVTPADGAAAGGDDASSPYPLQLGNVWKYRAHVTVRSIPDEGEPDEQEIIRTTKSEITGAAPLFGHCYVEEERTISEGGTDQYTQFVYYRQDRSGLYEATEVKDGPLDGAALRGVDPLEELDLRWRRNPEAWQAAFAAIRDRVQPLRAILAGRAGALDGELTRLQYPLHRGQEWVVIDDAFFMTARVEQRVLVDLPIGRTPAWKVHIESSLFGPDDDVCMFYGRDGYLGWQVSVIALAVDPSGEPIGTIHFIDEEYLESLAIDRRGESPCDTQPAGTGSGAGFAND